MLSIPHLSMKPLSSMGDNALNKSARFAFPPDRHTSPIPLEKGPLEGGTWACQLPGRHVFELSRLSLLLRVSAL